MKGLLGFKRRCISSRGPVVSQGRVRELWRNGFERGWKAYIFLIWSFGLGSGGGSGFIAPYQAIVCARRIFGGSDRCRFSCSLFRLLDDISAQAGSTSNLTHLGECKCFDSQLKNQTHCNSRGIEAVLTVAERATGEVWSRRRRRRLRRGAIGLRESVSL